MPEQPANSQPFDGESKAGRRPTLQGSPFADADAGETHMASQWRVTSVVGTYSSPVWDSGVDESNLTQMTIPAGTLEYDASYYWQVRYQDSQGSWSSWSAETGFGTGAAPSPPAALLIAAAVVGVVAVVAMTAPLMLPM
jgi:chitodextrinase